MLSKLDICKEIGKGICIYPFNKRNIKENSINLSTSEYAWTMASGDVFIDESGNCYNSNKEDKRKKITLSRGQSAVKEIKKKRYIILLPFSTTLIETKEVIGIGNNIGGAYHSKVGIVSQGIGHIGTMLGPNFCGHSLIAIHNISKYPQKIKVGETFVSITFEYLKTPISSLNATENGHLDKMASLGIKLNMDQTNEIGADWKKDRNEIKLKMINDKGYIEYKNEVKSMYREKMKSYINWSNFFVVLTIIAIILILYYICYLFDSKDGGTFGKEMFWNVFVSGVLIIILSRLVKAIKSR